jgi:hypothetical protein
MSRGYAVRRGKHSIFAIAATTKHSSRLLHVSFDVTQQIAATKQAPNDPYPQRVESATPT